MKVSPALAAFLGSALVTGMFQTASFQSAGLTRSEIAQVREVIPHLHVEGYQGLVDYRETLVCDIDLTPRNLVMGGDADTGTTTDSILLGYSSQPWDEAGMPVIRKSFVMSGWQSNSEFTNFEDSFLFGRAVGGGLCIEGFYVGSGASPDNYDFNEISIGRSTQTVRVAGVLQ